MNFYTLREAAQAIAEQLCPSDLEQRAVEASRYWHIIYNALCAGELTGRNPFGRDPISLARPGAVIALAGSVVNERDLNDWLDQLGNGVAVTDIPQDPAPVKLGPTTREFADLAEPYLCSGFGREELVKLLGGAKEDRGLKPLRTLYDDGRRARWNQPAKLVLELVARDKIMKQSAWQLVEEHFPDDIGDMGKRPEQNRSAAWHSSLFPRAASD